MLNKKGNTRIRYKRAEENGKGSVHLGGNFNW
jgi:hypothetical protein